MYIYRLLLELKEKVFFASREIHNLFQTEPVIGNYALCYAMGFIKNSPPYHVENVREERPTYKEDISPLNDIGIYITPATPVKIPEMELERFNAMVDSHWYTVAQNVVSGDLNIKIINLGLKKEDRIKPRPTCFPQSGRIRFLSRGSIFKCFLCSKEEIKVPHYIRVGKFMGKVKVSIEKVFCNLKSEEKSKYIIPFYLNPLDIGKEVEIKAYDLMSIHPVPLITNIESSGKFFKLDDDYLPAGMEFSFP